MSFLPKSVIRKKYFSQRATYCLCNNDSKGGGYRHGNYNLEKCDHAYNSHGNRHYFGVAWDSEEEICVFCGILFPGLLLLMCSVLFIFAEPYQIRKTMRTDCHILKLDAQYIVNINGKDIENIPVKEDTSREDYALEITENFNLAGMLLKTEYLLYVPVTTTMIQ